MVIVDAVVVFVIVVVMVFAVVFELLVTLCIYPYTSKLSSSDWELDESWDSMLYLRITMAY